MRKNNWQQWYSALIKPEWTPSGQVIGIIWSILYPLIIFSFFYVDYKTFKHQIPWYIFLVFIINIVANLLFTTIQFGWKNLPLASVDILIVLVTIILQMILIYPYSKIVAFLQVPYLVWVSTASYLQLYLSIFNR